MNAAPKPTIGECITHALTCEAMAAKPGNVHRGADFEDMTFADMVIAAAAIGGVLNRHAGTTLGEFVLSAVQAMRSAVEQNTHLGTILLIGPLAIASRRTGNLFENAAVVVEAATDNDTQLIYQAIRTALPAGLGEVDTGDVSNAPTTSLLEAMRLAADRDMVARQYTNRYADVSRIADRIANHRQAASLHDAIVAAHVEQMAQEPDSLIARKCGAGVARDAQTRAARAVDAGPLASEARLAALADLDFWLRADGHRRNPGTTADLIGAALFALLIEERISWPVRFFGPSPFTVGKPRAPSFARAEQEGFRPSRLPRRPDRSMG